MKYRKLFIPLIGILLMSSKQVNLIPGGQNIGIEIHPNGIIVSGTYDLSLGETTYNPARDSDIKRGDLITAVNSQSVFSIQEFIAQFNGNRSSTVDLTIKRNNTVLSRKLSLYSKNNIIKTGLYIKEKLLGVGTVSFYDPETKVYGALGHEVIDNDTGEIIEVKQGMTYNTKVTSIVKSTDGQPGSKQIDFKTSDTLGDILYNTSFGIYGNYEEVDNSLETIPMAYHDEVNIGKAQIWTVTEGLDVESYDIEITSLVKQSYIDTKGITFKITDSKLLNKTGGVIAGMSGSPIIQDGKLIGAVTHVLVDKVQYGYGIYMEWMWKEANLLRQN